MNPALALYAGEMLRYRLGDADQGYATAPCGPGTLRAALRQAVRTGRCVLLGLGSGELAARLARELSADVDFTVCETSPEQARRLGPRLGGALPVLADASPLTLVWLLLSVGVLPGTASLVLNPEVACARTRAQLAMLQRLHAAFVPLESVADEPVSAAGPPQDPSLSLAAILHPSEPDLEGFFAALPGWARQAVVVWDAQTVPDGAPGETPGGVPVLHLAHPLDGDFAAQRNRALAACAGDWVLMLDGDERLDPGLENLLPGLTRADRVGAVALSRRCLAAGRDMEDGEGQGARVKIGWGLWPDPQLRLFRRSPGVRFLRPVHERLSGVAGPTGLVLGPGIRHLSDVLKTPEQLAAKHALFDAALGGGVRHRANPVCPALPEAFFTGLSPRPLAGMWPEAVRFLPEPGAQ